MKNFKKVLFGVLAMLVMVTGVSAAGYNKVITDNVVEFEACLSTTDYDKVDCELTKSDVITADIHITKEVNMILDEGVTYNVTGKSIYVDSADPDVENSVDGKLTITGGKIYSRNNGSVIKAAAGTSLVINNNEIDAPNASHVIEVAGSAKAATKHDVQKYTTIELNGKIVSGNANGGILSVSSGDYYSVTLNGTMEAAGSAVMLYAGTKESANVTINGGTYTTTSASYALLDGSKSATWTIKNGTFKAENGKLLEIKYNSGNYSILVIENGNFTAKDVVLKTDDTSLQITNGEFLSYNNYALVFVKGEESFIKGGHFVNEDETNEPVNFTHSDKIIAGGTYEGSTNTRSYIASHVIDGLSAVEINKVVYVGKEYKLTIDVSNENGKATYLKTPVTLLAGANYEIKDFVVTEAAEGYTAVYTLVDSKGNEVAVTDGKITMLGEDATLKVTFVNEDEVKNPENQGEAVDPGTTTDPKDETTDKNPGTFDGIASFVTLAVSSLGAAGYSIKKVIKR